MKKIKSAFSLIELSVVILIIGILVIGITKGSRIIRTAKLSSARSLSRSSPLASTPNLVAWYDATNDGSFISGNYNDTAIDTTSIADGVLIKTWKDVNPQTTSDKKDGTVVVSNNNRPIYSTNGINGLPAITFDGTNDYFSLPDGTVPYGNSNYTIFFVASTKVLGPGGLLGSGTYAVANLTNAFRYDANVGYYNYWWNFDIAGTAGSIVVNKPQVLSFLYNGSARYVFVNGIQNATGAASNRASTPINNTIGRTSPALLEYLLGNIGEIIIFDRALTVTERSNIEQYLIKKWSISK